MVHIYKSTIEITVRHGEVYITDYNISYTEYHHTVGEEGERGGEREREREGGREGGREGERII